MLETRLSLLERVRDRTDDSAWADFVAIYRPLMMAYVRHQGIGEQDALDVVQNAFMKLLPALANFHLDHHRGRFRTWLWKVTHSAVVDWARRRDVQLRAENDWADQRDHLSAQDPSSSDWNAMFRRHVFETVISRVRESFQPTSWACFEGRILLNRPATDVAAELGVSANSVYVNASRVLARIRKECAEFAEPLSEER